MSTSGRQVRDNCLGCSGSLQIPVVVCEAHDRIGVSEVNPLGIVSGRIKGDTEVLAQAGREHGALLWFAVRRDTAVDLHLALVGFRDKQVAVWRRSNFPRSGHSRSVELDLESRNSLRPGVRG